MIAMLYVHIMSTHNLCCYRDLNFQSRRGRGVNNIFFIVIFSTTLSTTAALVPITALYYRLSKQFMNMDVSDFPGWRHPPSGPKEDGLLVLEQLWQLPARAGAADSQYTHEGPGWPQCYGSRSSPPNPLFSQVGWLSLLLAS